MRATPMQFSEFVSSAEAQRRYWARSYLGWRRIGRAQPNAGHRALVGLEGAGLCGVITQNVDGLHAAAGTSRVINLHGDIASVICLDCGRTAPRRHVQTRLARLNPGLAEPPALEHAELRPDGDAVVRDWHDFTLAGCEECGGRLKPDVVFFGESVPKPRVEAAYALVDGAEVLVVLGSSLTVMSGLRFVKRAARLDVPMVVVNRGPTRGDDLATHKLDLGTTAFLRELCQVTSRRRDTSTPAPANTSP
jgi:NAD-dependent SIR2 family protein deacetylase